MTKKSLRERFGGLYVRLIASYVLVTLVTMSTLILVVGVSQYLQGRRSPSNQKMVVQVLREQAPQLVGYLDGTPPDQQDLQSRIRPLLLDPLLTNANRVILFVAVWGQNGQIVASADCGQVLRITKECTTSVSASTLDTRSAPGMQTALHSVLAGDSVEANVPDALPNGGSFLALPVRGSFQTIVGAVGVVYGGRVDDDTSFGGFLAVYLHGLQQNNWQYFLLLATIIGTLAGVLISRGLRSRLRFITRAAEAWSQGELAVAVHDPTSDELGQLARDLDRMASQLQTLLASRQELAVVEERNRLARELHDTVKQHVFAGALLVRAARKLAASEPEKAQSYLADAETLAGETQQELIALIAALRPAAIADKGLVAVLRDEVANWSRRTSILVDLRIQGERTTPLDTEEALLRVAQEALANVARHSAARNVDVRLSWVNERVRLLIQDDGHGFDPEQVAGKGVGLASMRERMDALDGVLTIASAPGGTIIEASAPMPAVLPAAQVVPNTSNVQEVRR